MRRCAWYLLCFFCFAAGRLHAQDSSFTIEDKVVTLREVVVRSNLNVPAFVQRVKDDTSFYKAFLNLKVLGYTSLNDIRMLDKAGKTRAALISKTRQSVSDSCRWMQVLQESVSGDMYTSDKAFNYYTAQMYAGIFFARDTICGESNIVAGTSFNVQDKKGLARHKEQLKMLFFNPGKRIPGLPFIGSKIALFDEEVSARYDFIIDLADYRGKTCYVFKIVPLPGLSKAEQDQIVINDLTTWFDPGTWQIEGRSYDLSYNAGVYDFDVHIEVEMTRFGEYLVPRAMRYNGDWDVLFKKRERGIFTATLFGFNKP